MPTRIEWCDETLNPVVGCTKCSPGCKNCYAERMARRLQAMGLPQYQDVVDPDGYWTGEVGLNLAILDKLKHWKKPRRVFMVSMGDLFHDNVPFEFIASVWYRMQYAEQHTFQILTKRPERMREFMRYILTERPVLYKLPNVWLGVTAENQEQADKRIPVLLQIPAAVRFVSAEPMLGPVNIEEYLCPLENSGTEYYGQSEQICGDSLIDWVICGGETGPRARPMHPDWVRSLRDQCVEADVPFFFKSWGEWYPNDSRCPGFHEMYLKGGDARHLLVEDMAFARVGKRRAGRVLDGCDWNEFPS